MLSGDVLNFIFEREPLMAVLNAYMDESGKYGDKRIVAVGGICATPSAIKEFEECWEGLLRRYGMPSLSMKEALRLNRSLGKSVKAHTKRERIDALKPFADCIRQHVELSLAITVDVDGYAAMSPDARRRLGGSEDPHYLAFMTAVLGPVHHVKEGSYVHILFDDDEQTAVNSIKFYRRFRMISKEAHDRLIAISFAQDRQFPALQGADFVASLIRLEAHYQFERRPYDYRELFLHLTAPNSASGMKWGRSDFDKQRLSEFGKKIEKNSLGTKQVSLKPYVRPKQDKR